MSNIDKIEKEPQIRKKFIFRSIAIYTGFAIVLIQVCAVVFPALLFPAWAMTVLVVIVMFGFPIMLLLSWLSPKLIFKVHTSHLQYKYENTEGLITDYSEQGSLLTGSTQKSDVIRLAVLYVKNVGDSEDNYLCHGLTSDLIAEFSKLNEIQTPLLNEMLTVRDFEGGMEGLGRKLKVDYIVEGSLLKSGSNCLVNMQLMDVGRSVSLWNEKFSVAEDNLQQVRVSTLNGILKVLDIELPQHVKTLLKSESTENPQAYEFFLKGLYYLDMSSTRMDIEMSREFFKKAFDIDNAFILARIQHAMTYNKEGKYDIVADLLEEALVVATELNDQDGIAAIYNRFGILYMQLGKNFRSIGYYEKALKIQTKLDLKEEEAKTLMSIGICYTNVNRPEKSISSIERSMQIMEELRDEKGIAKCLTNLALSYKAMDRYGKSFETGELAVKICESFEMYHSIGRVLIVMGESLMYLRQYEKAVEILNRGRGITKKLNDTLGLGKILQIIGMVKYEEEKWEKAIDYFNEALEQFELAEFKTAVVEATFQTAITYIKSQDYINARKLLNKGLSFVNTSEDPINIQYTKAYILYTDTKEGNFNEEKGSELLDNMDSLNGENRKELAIMAELHFILYKIYACLGDSQTASKMGDKAQSILNERSCLIESKEDRKIYLLSRRIFREIKELQF